MEAYEEYEENYTASEEELDDPNSGDYDTADSENEMESSADVEEEDFADLKINDGHGSNMEEENDGISEYYSTEEDDEYTDIESEGFVGYTEDEEENKIDETEDAVSNVKSELELELEDTTDDGSTENNGNNYSKQNDNGEMSYEDLYTEKFVKKYDSFKDYSSDEEEGSAATELEKEVLSQLDAIENTEYNTDMDAAFKEETNIEDTHNDSSSVGTAVVLKPVEEDDWNEDDSWVAESEAESDNTENTQTASLSQSLPPQTSYSPSSMFLPDPEESPVFLRPEPEVVELQMRSADGPELSADMGSSWALHSDSAGPRLTSDLVTLLSSLLTASYIVTRLV